MSRADGGPRADVFAPLVVVAVVLAVAAAVVVSEVRCFDCGRTAWSWEADGYGLARVAERVHIYALRMDRLPTAEEGLAVVVGAERIPTDRWGRPYVYLPIDPASGRFDIVTYAADGEPGGTGQDEDLRYSDVATWHTEPSP